MDASADPCRSSRLSPFLVAVAAILAGRPSCLREVLPSSPDPARECRPWRSTFSATHRRRPRAERSCAPDRSRQDRRAPYEKLWSSLSVQYGQNGRAAPTGWRCAFVVHTVVSPLHDRGSGRSRRLTDTTPQTPLVCPCAQKPRHRPRSQSRHSRTTFRGDRAGRSRSSLRMACRRTFELPADLASAKRL